MMAIDKKQIINRLIDHYAQGSVTKFAAMVGVAQNTISTWKTKGRLDYDLIFAKCDGLSAEWLLTGEGEMTKKAAPETGAAHQDLDKLRSNLSSLQKSLEEAFHTLDQMDKHVFVGREYLESKLTSGQKKPHKSEG